MSKVQMGYTGNNSRRKNRKGEYAGRANGRVVHNGGFGGAPTVSYNAISQERWDAIDWKN